MTNFGRVHLAFVGFEVERVTEPLIQLRAKKAYLFTSDPDDNAKPYWDQIHRKLRKQHPDLDIQDKTGNPWDVGEILRTYKSIIEAERLRGNEVAINVSTGSKMAVLAGMLAAMLWGVPIYYVHIGYTKSDYLRDHPDAKLPPTVTMSPDGLVQSVERITWIPVLRVASPGDVELKVIAALMPVPDGLAKDALIRRLITAGALPPETMPTATATYMRLRRLLQPMQDAGYVQIDGERKKARVRLTGAGRDAGFLLIQPWLSTPRLPI